MATNTHSKSLIFGFFEFMELVFHSVVREVRTQSGNATFGILKEVSSIGIFLALFYMISVFLGRGAAIRGSVIMFLITGIIPFLIHTKAMGSVQSAQKASSAIMMHRPMTVMLSILSKAFGGLYLQAVAILLILLVFWVLGADLRVDNFKGMVVPMILVWASGIAVGMVFMTFRPIIPVVFEIISPIYRRAQMFTSGKFLPAAYMPGAMVHWFSWNPLFHSIDQIRDAAFVNYHSEVTSISYPLWFTLVALLIGLMGEFWARKTLSMSKHEK